MPATSKKQQRFFGMVHAAQKGDMKSPSKAVSDVAQSIDSSDARDFASTKHKGLPMKKKTEKRSTEKLAEVKKTATLVTNFLLLKEAGLVGRTPPVATAPSAVRASGNKSMRPGGLAALLGGRPSLAGNAMRRPGRTTGKPSEG